MKTTLLGEVRRLQEKGNKKSLNQKTMSKYDFIKQGNLLFWHTADNDVECRIISTPEKVDSDSIILISTGSSETEVLASELLPIGSSRSHKEEFMRWKKERAFRKPWNGGRCVYIDSDAYWFPDRPEQLTILSKGGTE